MLKMQNDDTHIPDAELLELLDGEATGRDIARIQAHLGECWRCRSRRAKLEGTIEGFIRAHRAQPGMPPIDVSREQLRARLRQAGRPLTAPELPRRRFAFKPRLALGTAAAGALLALGIVYLNVQDVAASTPNVHLTPGAIRTASREEICSTADTKGFYPIPATLAYRVFEKYKIRNPGHRSYEVDYLITPALGGADDIRNLWPQPYVSGEWNAHVKDALEHYLHHEVCAGNLDLETAQRDISTDWIAAYRKYFKTNVPLAKHGEFSVDPPWED
jgi:hypothetical protein